jgi:hypothetical protein
VKYNKQSQAIKTELPKTDHSDIPHPFQKSAFALILTPSKIASATWAGNPAGNWPPG